MGTSSCFLLVLRYRSLDEELERLRSTTVIGICFVNDNMKDDQNRYMQNVIDPA